VGRPAGRPVRGGGGGGAGAAVGVRGSPSGLEGGGVARRAHWVGIWGAGPPRPWVAAQGRRRPGGCDGSGVG